MTTFTDGVWLLLGLLAAVTVAIIYDYLASRR